MIKSGDTAWVQPGTDRAYVGVVEEISAVEIVLRDAVQVHDHGHWESFHAGLMTHAETGYRAHLSANPEGSLMTLPRLVCRTMVYRGEGGLERLREWAGEP